MNLFYEIIGYIGTVLVVLSMAMSSMKRLRIINISGSIISAAYSVLVGAYPIVLMNACLILINLFRLIKDGGEPKGENE